MEESMTDAERDSLEANITGFLVECRAGLDGVSREILSSNYLETNAMRLALDRIKQLSARFDRLQQLRYHRDLLKRRAVSTSQKNDPWKSSRDRAAKTRRREEAGLDEPRTEAVVESSYAKTPNQRQQLVLQKEREILATQVERDLDVRTLHSSLVIAERLLSRAGRETRRIANAADNAAHVDIFVARQRAAGNDCRPLRCCRRHSRRHRQRGSSAPERRQAFLDFSCLFQHPRPIRRLHPPRHALDALVVVISR